MQPPKQKATLPRSVSSHLPRQLSTSKALPARSGSRNRRDVRARGQSLEQSQTRSWRDLRKSIVPVGEHVRQELFVPGQIPQLFLDGFEFLPRQGSHQRTGSSALVSHPERLG